MRVALVALETARHTDAESVRRVERVARSLTDRGHEVTLFCGQWWDDYRDEFEANGVCYRSVTYGTALASFCTRLPALLARYRPDVIHAAVVPPQQVVTALAAGQLARAPVVVEWYGTEELEGHRLAGTIAGRPDCVVTPSEFVRTDVRELGATEANTTVVPESIDFSLTETTDPADDVDIVYARRLDESANLDDFLLGLAELRERDWQATVVGDGPLREEYEADAEKLRIDDRVRFVGDCDRTRRVSLYQGAHAFVQTALREQFATELLWALACGCVGIVEYQAESSAHELIEHHERAYRVTDPEEIADAIADASEFPHLTTDDEWARFDHDAVVEQYLETYGRL
ncbi:Glycosyltransferase involved in cell wall bisynthesis [Halovenus aranensis]|uniref:Glycosyltransferase involved in cell wall bisynthesis n=1 Tax=Halovenus aranensis TaxID=890420 RepID=A0A1G8X6H2_9EURY|nr:glycosyltransferase family 4 protein [Halovenus aranensis]SDJ86228.1 Glycosyltransferase involved in cell wall bisynthesis [Halovenus aranensis]